MHPNFRNNAMHTSWDFDQAVKISVRVSVKSAQIETYRFEGEEEYEDLT